MKIMRVAIHTKPATEVMIPSTPPIIPRVFVALDILNPLTNQCSNPPLNHKQPLAEALYSVLGGVDRVFCTTGIEKATGNKTCVNGVNSFHFIQYTLQKNSCFN